MDKVLLFLIVVVLIAGGTITYGDFSFGDVKILDKIRGKDNPEIWLGHFIDLSDDTGELTFYDERLTINTNSNGTFEAEVNSVQDSREKAWSYKGFTAGEYLTVSYRNTKKETGIGSIFLEKKRNEYIGYWTGKTCNGKKIISCPYILSSSSGANLTIFNTQMRKVGCKILDVASMTSMPYVTKVACN